MRRLRGRGTSGLVPLPAAVVATAAFALWLFGLVAAGQVDAYDDPPEYLPKLFL